MGAGRACGRGARGGPREWAERLLDAGTSGLAERGVWVQRGGSLSAVWGGTRKWAGLPEIWASPAVPGAC